MDRPDVSADALLARPLRALFLEDNPRDAKLMVATLERAGWTLRADRLDSVDAFQKSLRETEYDIILSDYNLSGWTAIEALDLVRQSGKDTPVLVVSGNLGDEAAADCIKKGAADYVLKDRLARLPAAISHALGARAERRARRKAEQALRVSEERYRRLFDYNPHAMWVFDCQSLRFLEVNEAAIRRYGYWKDAFLSMTVKDIHVPEDVPQLLEKLKNSPDLVIGLWRHRTAVGEVLDVEVTLHRLRLEGRDAMLSLVDDVSYRMRADALVRSSEERFRHAFNASPEPIAITAVSGGRYLDVNNAFLQATGHRRQDVVGKTALELGFWLTPEDEDKVLKAREGGRARDLEVEFGNKSGQVRTGLVSEEPVEWGGQPCLLTVIRDITERKNLEQQFRQAQKMEAVGQLAGGVAHDFNNLLMVINGYSDVVLQNLSADHPLRNAAAEIKKPGDRAAALTRQLLAFSRQQVLQPRILDLNTLVDGMSAMLGRLIGEDLKLVVIRGQELGRVRVDAGQMEQVILNLALNARDAMPRGGQLTIETRNVELDESYTRNHAQMKSGPHVLLAVSDTGTGMDSETQKHIFEPFFTTKQRGKGTGLGLSTVYGIVKQSEGSIWVCSETGQGATFKIYLPRADARELAAQAARRPPGPASEGCTVLLAEDDLSVRLLVCELLASMGYTVLEAGDGTEALRIAEEHPGPIHALVTDVVMPGTGGQTLGDRLSASRPETKVLYMSGYTDEVVVQRGLLNANVAFIQKPFTSQALAQKLAELLNRS